MRFRNLVLWGMLVPLVFCGLANGEELPAAEQKGSTVSPGKAFLFSLLVPGSGQLYAGEKRGVAFLALEAVVWPAYFSWRNKGKDIEKDYQKFADAHWEFENRYKVYRDYVRTTADASKLSHNYEKATQQQKYEMIGKYDQFVFGWDDSEPSLREVQERLQEYPPDSLKNVSSPRREEYMDMRYDSNKYLKRAGWCVGTLLANHILSAIDAAHCAQLKRKGLSLEKRVRVRMAVGFEGEEVVPMLCLSKRF